MSSAVYRDPTFNAAVAMEVRKKKGCGVCIRRISVLGAYLCSVNANYPQCKNNKKGFVYDEGK
jgi:hypothetical protein